MGAAEMTSGGPTRPCDRCQTAFVRRSNAQRLCSPECVKAQKNERQNERQRNRTKTPEEIAANRAWERSPHGRELNRAACAKYRGSEHGKAVRAAVQKQLHAQRKAAGLCIRCPEPADPGYTMCGACLRRDREKVNEWRLRKAAKST